jgi:hypothetical protein
MRTMITAAIVRKLALGLPGAVESSHFDVADFRVRNKIFATIHPGGKTGVLLRLDPDLAAGLAEAAPETFSRVGAGGRALQVVFARIDRAQYQHLLQQAWQAIAPKKTSSRRAPTRKGG